MATLKIHELIKHAYTFEDGYVIFEEAIKYLDEGIPITISFEKIDSIPSSFTNGCFIELLKKYGIATLKEKIAIIHSTRQINEMIKSRIEFERKRIDNTK